MLRVRRGFTEVSARRGKPAVFAEGPGRRALSSHRGTAMCWERWMRRVRRGFTEVSAKCGKPAVFAAREGPGKAGALIASRNRDVVGAMDAARPARLDCGESKVREVGGVRCEGAAGKPGAPVASRNRDVLGAVDAARVRHGLTEVRAKCGKSAVFAARERPGRPALPSLRASRDVLGAMDAARPAWLY